MYNLYPRELGEGNKTNTKTARNGMDERRWKR